MLADHCAVVLDGERAGSQLVVSADGRSVTQTGQTQHFDGAWVLGSAGLSRGRWLLTFRVVKRRRWMAVGLALEGVRLNKPINKSNIFVYASSGSIKANDHLACAALEDAGDAASNSESNAAWAASGDVYKADDVVRAHLDLDEGTLAFSLNAADGAPPPPPAYSRLRGLALFPAIYVAGHQDQVDFDCSRVLDAVETPNFLRFFEGESLGGIDAVTFVVGGQRVRAHKFVLAARSDYFRALIANQRMRKRPPPAADPPSATDDDESALDEICICGASYDTFTAVLRFIYSGGEAEVPPDLVVEIFRLASEYALRPLALRCVDHMYDSVTAENALSIFTLCEAYLPLTERLKNRCIEVIRDNVDEVVDSPSFAELCADVRLVKQLFVPLCSSASKRQCVSRPSED
ncbi:hypothetical protein M885DRAFT_543572 [Pelagophyceae sp. CCMP2097]|nr:hypothetical protein M885DRAFT_543572 [Pelagophyceae sp. CCMP2097]